MDRQFEQTDKINVFWFAFFEFGLVCLIEFGLVWLFHRQTNKLNTKLQQTKIYLFFLFVQTVYPNQTKPSEQKIQN